MQDIKPSAGSVHKAPQKSKTLNRKYTKNQPRTPNVKFRLIIVAKKSKLEQAERPIYLRMPAFLNLAKNHYSKNLT